MYTNACFPLFFALFSSWWNRGIFFWQKRREEEGKRLSVLSTERNVSIQTRDEDVLVLFSVSPWERRTGMQKKKKNTVKIKVKRNGEESVYAV